MSGSQRGYSQKEKEIMTLRVDLKSLWGHKKVIESLCSVLSILQSPQTVEA